SRRQHDAAPRGSVRDPTTSGNAADTAPSGPTAAPTPTGAPRPRGGRRAPSSDDHHNWDTTPALCTRTVPGARARTPRTETTLRRARRHRTSGTPGTPARRIAAGSPRRWPPPPCAGAGSPYSVVFRWVGDQLVTNFKAPPWP